MAGAGERQLTGLREARSGRAEGYVGVLRRGGVLCGASSQERYLIDDVFHLMRQRLRYSRRWLGRGIPEVRVRVCVTSKFYRCSKSFARTRSTLKRRLYYSYDTTRSLATSIARPRLMRLQRSSRRECHLAMFANIAKIEVRFAGARRELGDRRW